MNLNSHFPRYFTSKAIVTYLILLMAVTILFFGRRMDLLWVVFGIAEVAAFFYFSNRLSGKWQNAPPKVLERRLFRTAFAIRAFFVVFLYFFFREMTGEPYEFGVADAMGYHNEALWILDLFSEGNLEHYFRNYLKGFSDSGWPILLSVIYILFFKSIIVARLFNALFSAWMVVLIYRLANRNFGDAAARIAAVMAMLLPNFIYYSGLHLKETVMVFLLVAFAERADYLVRTRVFKTWNTLVVVLLGLSLFFFRTVLAGAAWFALFSAFLFTSSRLLGSARRIFYVTWFIVAALLIFSGTILQEVEQYWTMRDSNLERQMYSYSIKEGGNRLAQYGSQAVFAPIILVAPFPTLVNTEQLNQNMINGNMFTRNVYAFFVLVALWVLYKRKLLRNHVLILVILVSYLFILSASGFALSERFHLPALPFLIILAGYGIANTGRKTASLYVPYLLLIFILVVAWNWFKLAGRM